MNYKTSYNFTTNSIKTKLKKLCIKLSYTFPKTKYITQSIDILSQIQRINRNIIDYFDYIKKINIKLLKKLRKQKEIDKYAITFINFLLFLSEDTDFHPHLYDMFKKPYNSIFDDNFKYDIINILGNSIENNYYVLQNTNLIKYIFQQIKTCSSTKLSIFIPFLSNFLQQYSATGKILLPKYDYIMVRYVKYVDNLTCEDEISKWIDIIIKLTTTHNIVYFFKHSGYEKLEKIREKYYYNRDIRSEINLIKYKMTNYVSKNTTSLHQLCKHENSVSSIKFMLQNTEIDYNLKDSCGKTPIHIAIHRSNKPVIALLISCGVDLDIPGRRKKKSIKKILYQHLNIYHKTDPLFVNVIQHSFIKRTLNDKFINETIESFGFYKNINSIIKLYVDPVTEYFKNEQQIDYIMKNCNKI